MSEGDAVEPKPFSVILTERMKEFNEIKQQSRLNLDIKADVHKARTVAFDGLADLVAKEVASTPTGGREEAFDSAFEIVSNSWGSGPEAMPPRSRDKFVKNTLLKAVNYASEESSKG